MQQSLQQSGSEDNITCGGSGRQNRCAEQRWKIRTDSAPVPPIGWSTAEHPCEAKGMPSFTEYKNAGKDDTVFSPIPTLEELYNRVKVNTAFLTWRNMG